MRIAIVHTADPPGATGRITQDIAQALAKRGHGVTLIGATHPPASLDGVEIVRAWRPPRVRALDWYEPGLDAAPGVLWHVLRGSYDVMHSFDPAPAWAAVRAAPLGAPPTVLSLHDPPERRYLVGRRYRLDMLQACVGGCAAITVPSEASATLFRRYLMADPAVVPPATGDSLPAYEELYCAAIKPAGAR